MPFVPDSGGHFVPDEEWSNVPKNAAHDLGGLAKAGVNAIKQVADPLNLVESAASGSMQPTKDYLAKAERVVPQIPGAIYNDTKDLITHPIESFKKHPVNTALNAWGLGETGLGAAKLAVGGAGAGGEAASLADEAANAGASTADDAARSATTAPEAAQAAGAPAAPPEPSAPAASTPNGVGSVVNDAVDALGARAKSAVQKPLDEVGDFLSQKYGKVAEKPGFAQTLGELADRKAKIMRLKEIGLSPGQARKLRQDFGEDKLMELSDLAKEKGITDSVIGHRIGKGIQDLNSTAGQTIGGIREIASKRGAVHDPGSLVNQIRQELDPVYLGKGTASAQKGQYMKALEDIKSSATTPQELAKKITWMNEQAVKNKMTQPAGATTDVANAASRVNNDLISKFLSPKEAETYKGALKDFGASKVLDKMYSMRFGREVASRSGALGDIFSNVISWGKDAFGNKFMENVYDKLGKSIKENPGIVKQPKVLSQQVLDQMLKTLDEMGEEFVQ